MANYKEMEHPNSKCHKIFLIFAVIGITGCILTFFFVYSYTSLELKECKANYKISMAQLQQLRDVQVTIPAPTGTLPPSVTPSPLVDLGTLTKEEALKCNCGNGTCAKLYQHVEYKGATTCVHDLKKEKACQNLSEWWQARQYTTTRVSSLKTIGCVRLWAGMDCHGASIQIQPGTKGTDNLTLFNFNDMTSDMTRSLGIICDVL